MSESFGFEKHRCAVLRCQRTSTRPIVFVPSDDQHNGLRRLEKVVCAEHYIGLIGGDAWQIDDGQNALLIGPDVADDVRIGSPDWVAIDDFP